MKKYILGNWKLNPLEPDEVKRIIQSLKKISSKLKNMEIVVFPPAIFAHLALGKKKIPNFKAGIQDIFYEESGAYTGKISAPMAKNLGLEMVIVGHSEMREGGDNDALVALKTLSALKAGLQTILCIGEKERDSQGEYMNFLRNQIRASLEKMPKRYIKQLFIAYEPIWAIGSLEAMEPSAVYETSLFIKKTLADIYGQEEAVKVPILYGGAVNFRNAKEIVDGGKIDGLLVGRESLNSDGFLEIIKALN